MEPSSNSDSLVFIIFVLLRGSGEGSTSTSSVVDRIVLAMGCDEAGLFFKEASFFLLSAPEGADFFGEEDTPLSTTADDTPAAYLDFFGASLYVRSWSGSNSIRVEIHP